MDNSKGIVKLDDEQLDHVSGGIEEVILSTEPAADRHTGSLKRGCWDRLRRRKRTESARCTAGSACERLIPGEE